MEAIDPGIKKSAVLMLALGEDEAAEVMKHLGPREVQKLGEAMAMMKSVSREEMDAVLVEFCDEADRSSGIGLDSDAYIRSVLTKALGDDKAASLINRITHSSDTSGIDGLKWMDAPSVADLIRDEHPQIIATILVHLDADQASGVLTQFADRLRDDVMLRIATLDGVQPTALRELNDVLTKLLTGQQNVKKKPMGGVRQAADILNYMGSTNESAVLEALKGYDADLAQKIMDEMFVFDDLIKLEGRDIQLLLREVQSESLIVALKGGSPELREKIFANMSQRAAETMRDDLDSKGPVKLSDVEAQQKAILQIVRRLVDEGQLAIGGKGDEAYV